MFALALALPVLLPFDTLIFEDGATHILDETAVDPGDDILVRGIGFGSSQRTTVILTGTAEARNVTIRPGAVVRLEESSKVQDVTTEGMSFVGPILQVGDSTEVVGAITLNTNGIATLGGNARVGSVSLDHDDSLNLEEDAVITGDVTSLGAVRVAGGTVLGTMDLMRGMIVDESQGPIEFTGPVRLGGNSRPTVTRSRFLSDLELTEFSRIEFGGTSEIRGVLKLRDDALAILSVTSASVPTSVISDSTGVITTINTEGGHAFYTYDREPSASLFVERVDAPTSTTSCVQTLPNSTGVAAHVTALGGTFASEGRLILRASQVPQNSFSFFFVGDARVPGITQSGDICTGGNIGRFVGPGQIMNSGSSGTIQVEIDTTQIPGNPPSSAVPGSTYYFQLWNRDFVGGAPGSRFSDTAAVTFR